jgi:hypothetical protein
MMTMYSTEDMVTEELVNIPRATLTPEESCADNPMFVEETSLSHFCEFVDYYTHHASDPLYTAAACEQQAEAVRITPPDVNQESIQMLIETMILAIDHLEKKWLDEQILREESEQRHHQDRVHLHSNSVKLHRKQKRYGMMHVFFQSARWMWQHVLRHKPVPRHEVAAW